MKNDHHSRLYCQDQIVTIKPPSSIPAISSSGTPPIGQVKISSSEFEELRFSSCSNTFIILFRGVVFIASNLQRLVLGYMAQEIVLPCSYTRFNQPLKICVEGGGATQLPSARSTFRDGEGGNCDNLVRYKILNLLATAINIMMDSGWVAMRRVLVLADKLLFEREECL